MNRSLKLAILGAGNLGTAIASGLLRSGVYDPARIILTRRRVEKIARFKEDGFVVQADNKDAVRRSRIILIAVEPQKINQLLEEIKEEVDAEKHTIISVVTGVKIAQIRRILNSEVVIVRAMPNTAIAIGESMTCLATTRKKDQALAVANKIFDTVGITQIIEEENMTAATALAACGIAFFLRAVRAASQGGIEIGFDSDKAIKIAAQTAKGAASLLLKNGRHPEFEIDRVTTPRGITISGLNQMEHEGFSSAMIRGIVTSWTKASKVYPDNEDG